MKKEIVYVASAVLALVSCGGPAKQAGELTVIPMEAAFAEQAGLNLSECFKKVRYVPLETMDSSLVGKYSLPKINIATCSTNRRGGSSEASGT